MANTRIVIADDEPDTLKIWSAAFGAKGYEVLEAGDGEVALKLIEEHQPQAALLDFMMPNMDGIAVCEQVRQTNEDIFILIVSGIGSEKLKVLSEKARANGYLEKPVRPAELLDAIQTGLASRASS